MIIKFYLDVVHFVPGLDRKRPHHIELKLNLEPKSVYSIYFKAEFAYLKWDEFPPDVNHGFYINPAVVEIDFNDNLKHLTHYRYPYLSTNIYEKYTNFSFLNYFFTGFI